MSAIIAFVVGLLLGPVMQLFLSWLLVTLLMWAAAAAVRRCGRQVVRRWRELVAQVRRARFSVVA